MTANAAEHQIPLEPRRSPGRQLRERRQTRGIELDRVAAQLHLPREVIEALEQDRYDQIAAPVYAAGYLKNYARLLGLAPEPIIEAYREFAGQPEPEPPRLTAAPVARHAKSSGMPRATLLALVALGISLVTGLVWWQTRPNPANELAPGESISADQQQTEPSEPLAETAAPVTTSSLSTSTAAESAPSQSALSGAQDETAAAAEPPLLATTAASGETSATPTTGDTPAESATGAAAAEPADAQEVVLKFSGTSWVDVRGADGAIVIHGEMREGDSQTLKGQAPYKFVIGNVAATELTIGGKSFDIAGRSRGNVARFTLDPASVQ